MPFANISLLSMRLTGDTITPAQLRRGALTAVFSYNRRASGKVTRPIDIVALHQLLEHVEARFRFLDRSELKFVRDNREIGKAPFPAFHIQLAR